MEPVFRRGLLWTHLSQEESVQAHPNARSFIGSLRLLSRAWSVRLIATHCLAALIWRCLLGPPVLGDALLVVAIALYWPFQEWAAHAFLLHFKPREFSLPGGRTWRLDPLAGRVHRFHHRHPWRLHPIFLPWPIILVLVPIHIGLWTLLTPTRSLACTGIVVFGAAAIFYEWLHLIAHLPWVPPSAWLRHVQQHHRAHHFKNERYWHAFSVPAIDRWFGTGPDPRDTPRSDTCRTLGVDEVFPDSLPPR